jgi:hypothetical protein
MSKPIHKNLPSYPDISTLKDSVILGKDVTVIQANFKVAIHLAPLEVIGQNRNRDGIV